MTNITTTRRKILLELKRTTALAEMSYNGLGQRLSMDAAGVIATYVMDGDRPLTAESAGNTTFYLHGLGAIAEKTTAWNYSLPDGTNTPRQLTDSSGDITLTSRYTPWGDTLDTYGTGNFSFGYLGGVLDTTTGLLYVGNGQYYDPATGRFLTRGVNSDNTNPYVPWNPIGAIVGPMGLIALVFGRKKKGSKVGTFLVLLLVVGSVGMTLAGCGGGVGGQQPTSTPTPTPTLPPPNVKVIGDDGAVTINGTLVSTPVPSPTNSPTATPCTPTATPVSTSTPPNNNWDEDQKKEYIESFGFVLLGNWTGAILNNLWEALFTHIGYQDLKLWLNYNLNYNHVVLNIGGIGDNDPGESSGYTQQDTITFYQNEAVNPVINFLHEIGHVVDNLWADYFTTQLEKETFTLDRRYVAGWDGTAY